MASRSLGTLTLDLIAKIGGFTGPLDKASRESQKRMAEIKKSAEQIGIGIGAGVAAGVTALAALTVSSVKAGNEITRFAQVSGASTTEFQKYAAGAKAVGIEQDKLSDIFKDTNDKVGDFLSTGGGELQNFFTSIAPKVGVTAEQFRNLSGPQALQLYVSSLEKAKVSQSEMTFYMEAIANDATLLTPLLRNNGEGFKVLGESALAAGAIMDEKTIKATQELSAALLLADQATDGLKNQLTAEMLPVLSDLANVFLDVSVDGTAAAGMASILSDTLRITAQVAVGVVASFDLIGSSLGGLGVKFANFKVPNWAKALIDPMEGLQGIVDDATAKANGAGQSAGDLVNEDLEQKIFKYSSIIEALGKAGSSGETNTKVKELAELLTKLRSEGNTPGTFNALTKEQQAAGKAAEAAAKKLQGAFDTTEEGYERQIQLINTSNDKRKDATEVAKLSFDIESGKLVGINAQQQQRLEGLAAELDSLNKLKQANEEAAKLASFTAGLKDENSTIKQSFDVEFAGAASGDMLKERLQQDLQIQLDYNTKQADLQKQFQGGDITQSLYDTETEVLREALAERMLLQEEYYSRTDSLQGQGVTGFVSGMATQVEASMDLYSTMQSVGAETFHNLTDAITEWAETGKLDAKGLAASFIQSVGHALLTYAAAQVAMAGLSAFTAMIGIPFVGPVVAPGAAIAATAAAGVMMTAVGSALDGQAHDGIDYVPADGTWNLKKGERVTTAETSAKLDRTLSSIQLDKSGQSGAVPEVHIHEDAARAGRSQARSDGGVDLWVSNIMSEGSAHQALEAKYGLRAVGR